MTKKAHEDWSTFYKSVSMDGSEMLWPSEILIRLFRGKYIDGLDKKYAGRRVIDVGFGTGNNLFFLSTLGLDVSGVEVTQEICSLVGKKLEKSDCDFNLQVGTNVDIPFEDDTFDYLISWNVIHYADDEAIILRSLEEYCRVLKPGGRFFLSTTGPEHGILKQAEALGEHCYRIGRDDDFRKGQVYFYFDTKEEVRRYFSKYFQEIQVGRIRDFLMKEMQDYFIVSGTKP